MLFLILSASFQNNLAVKPYHNEIGKYRNPALNIFSFNVIYFYGSELRPEKGKDRRQQVYIRLDKNPFPRFIYFIILNVTQPLRHLHRVHTSFTFCWEFVASSFLLPVLNRVWKTINFSWSGKGISSKIYTPHIADNINEYILMACSSFPSGAHWCTH